MANYYSMILTLCIGIAALFLYRYLSSNRSVGEPPTIGSKIPLVGNVLALLFYGTDYLRQLEHRHHQPIYTLPVLGGRVYVVCSPEWVTAIHRSRQGVSFENLVQRAFKSLFQFDEPAMKLMTRPKDGDPAGRSIVLEQGHDVLEKVLGPGLALDEMVVSVLAEEAKRVNSLAIEGCTHEIKLWDWVRHHLAMASVSAIWGPENPYALNPALLDDFWTLEKNSVMLTMLPFPSVTCAPAHQARQRVFDGWAEYTDKERYKSGSMLAQARAEFNLERFDFSKPMFGRGEVSMNFGVLSNTIPIAFWMIALIFADRALLSALREEIDHCTSVAPDQDYKRVISLDALRTRCPLLLATFRETSRLVGGINIARYVVADTHVANPTSGETHLLKKDSVVLIATNAIHAQQSVWGDDVDTFNPRRFRAEGGTARAVDPAAPFKSADGKTQTGWWRTFGSNSYMCLGRHFALAEILGLAALFVAGFEVVDRGAEWGLTPPPIPKYKAPMEMTALHPAADIEVDVRRRSGYQKTEWTVEP
jgi:hypothetical protein